MNQKQYEDFINTITRQSWPIEPSVQSVGEVRLCHNLRTSTKNILKKLPSELFYPIVIDPRYPNAHGKGIAYSFYEMLGTEITSPHNMIIKGEVQKTEFLIARGWPAKPAAKIARSTGPFVDLDDRRRIHLVEIIKSNDGRFSGIAVTSKTEGGTLNETFYNKLKERSISGLLCIEDWRTIGEYSYNMNYNADPEKTWKELSAHERNRYLVNVIRHLNSTYDEMLETINSNPAVTEHDKSMLHHAFDNMMLRMIIKDYPSLAATATERLDYRDYKLEELNEWLENNKDNFDNWLESGFEIIQHSV